MVAVLRKDIMRLMRTERIMPRVWLHRRSMRQPPREGQCMVPKRLAKYGWWKCQQSNTHISQRTHPLIIGNSLSNQEIHKETSTPRRSVWGLVILAHPRPTVREGTLYITTPPKVSDPSSS